MTDKKRHCRACGSPALRPAFSLGAGNDWVLCDPERDATACGLLQRDGLARRPALRERRISRTRRHRLRAATTELMEMVTARDARALDIGCGDGTLLSYLPRWIDACGIDEDAPREGDRVYGERLTGAFLSAGAADDIAEFLDGHTFDIITAVSVLGREDDPVAFLGTAKELLSPDGVLMIETPYASLALMRDDPSAFNDEMQSLFTLTVLEDMATRAGLKIVRGSMTETDGGSLRLYLTHDEFCGLDDAGWLSQLARLWDEERSLDLASPQTCQAFAWRTRTARLEAEALVARMAEPDTRVIAIGLDARMQALLSWHGIDGRHLDAIVSRDDTLDGAHLNLGEGPSVDIICERGGDLPAADIIIAPVAERREALEHWREAIFNDAELVFLTPGVLQVNDMNFGAELGKALAITDGPGSVDTLRTVIATMRRPHLVAANTGT